MASGPAQSGRTACCCAYCPCGGCPSGGRGGWNAPPCPGAPGPAGPPGAPGRPERRAGSRRQAAGSQDRSAGTRRPASHPVRPGRRARPAPGCPGPSRLDPGRPASSHPAPGHRARGRPSAGSAPGQETLADPAARRHIPPIQARRCRDVPGDHAAVRGMTHDESRRSSGEGFWRCGTRLSVPGGRANGTGTTPNYRRLVRSRGWDLAVLPAPTSSKSHEYDLGTRLPIPVTIS